MSNARTRLGMVLLVLAGFAAQAGGQEGALTPEQVAKIRRAFQLDGRLRATRNALTGTSIRNIAKNRDVLVDHNKKFSHKIKTKGISNQKSSGRCWMFAGFNTIKPVLMNNLDLGDFEFSQIYLQFWDKMEKANSFLEYMIAYRDRDLAGPRGGVPAQVAGAGRRVLGELRGPGDEVRRDSEGGDG